MTNLEDKAQYEKENNVKIPDKLSAYCDGCKQEKEFDFFGIQQAFGKIPAYILYNCAGSNNVKHTKTYQALINKFNAVIIE